MTIENLRATLVKAEQALSETEERLAAAIVERDERLTATSMLSAERLAAEVTPEMDKRAKDVARLRRLKGKHAAAKVDALNALELAQDEDADTGLTIGTPHADLVEQIRAAWTIVGRYGCADAVRLKRNDYDQILFRYGETCYTHFAQLVGLLAQYAVRTGRIYGSGEPYLISELVNSADVAAMMEEVLSEYPPDDDGDFDVSIVLSGGVAAVVAEAV